MLGKAETRTTREVGGCGTVICCRYDTLCSHSLYPYTTRKSTHFQIERPETGKMQCYAADLSTNATYLSGNVFNREGRGTE